MQEDAEASYSSGAAADEEPSGRRRLRSASENVVLPDGSPDDSDTEPLDDSHLRKGGLKRSKRRRISLAQLRAQFNKPLTEAAEALDIGVSTLKRLCREKRIAKWPHREWCSVNTAISNLTARQHRLSDHKESEEDAKEPGKTTDPTVELVKDDLTVELEWLLQRREALMNLGVDTCRKTVARKRRPNQSPTERSSRRPSLVSCDDVPAESAREPAAAAPPAAAASAEEKTAHGSAAAPPMYFTGAAQPTWRVPPPSMSHPYWDALRGPYPDPYMLPPEHFLHPLPLPPAAHSGGHFQSSEPLLYRHPSFPQSPFVPPPVYYHPGYYPLRRGDPSQMYSRSYHSR